MYKICSFLFATILAYSSFALDEDIVKSTISEVTVYSQGAQISQKASYSIKSGVTQIIIEGISPKIDPNSLQVNASGNVIIIDAKYSLFYPKPEPTNIDGLPLKVRRDIDLLEDSLRKLNFDIQDIQDEIDVYLATKNILASNGAIRGQGKVNDSIQLLKQAMEYYTTKMKEINKSLQALNRQKAQKLEIKSGMNERLNGLKNYQNNAQLKPKPKGPSHRVTITLSSKEALTGKLHLSYLVNDAGWIPLYDMRADATSSKINMNYKAQVFQNTGIDWEDVKLSISTNNPYVNKTMPSMHPWYVDYNNYRTQAAGAPINQVKSLELKKERLGYEKEAKAESDDVQVFTNSNGVRYDAKTSADFMQVVDHAISAEFKIDLPYSIPSNNEKHMVLIRNMDIPTIYRHYSVPKLDPSAYLVAELANLSDYQLVPAKANIFFEGTYMGETYLNPSQMDDTISFSLGKDPNIMVKRTLMKKDCKEKIIGGQKEKTTAYDIEVKNLKSTAVEIIIIDQLPITTNQDILIEAIELSKAVHNEKTGKLEWTLKLKAKETKTLELKYKVKHNKDMPLYL